MFGFKKRRIQRKLPPITAKNEHELGCALLDAFRMMDAGQQVCLHCHERGGFGMSHHPNCIIGVAASHLFRHAKGAPGPGPFRYLTFDEQR